MPIEDLTLRHLKAAPDSSVVQKNPSGGFQQTFAVLLKCFAVVSANVGAASGIRTGGYGGLGNTVSAKD
jgi:hypothetical protein